MKRSLYLLVFLLTLWPQMVRAQCPVGAWTNPTTPPAIAEWSTVAYGNGRYVALATSGAARVAWSADGMTWNAPATSIPNNSWRWVTFANGMFIAVGYDGTRRVMTSTNGSNWTIVNNGTANSGAWQSVTYGKGLYVAVANTGSNRVATSPNGTTWTARSVPTAPWSTVYYANGRFIALPFNGTTAMYSDDGILWTPTSIPSGGWLDVVYGNGQFVAVSWTGTHIATSPDGITWTGRSVPDSRNWNGIEYVGGHYMVVGGGGSGANRTMISADGITWVPQPIAHGGQTLGDIIWGGDKLIVIGADMYTGAIQFFVGSCPYQCYMPNAPVGAREWFSGRARYEYCSGTNGWQPFSLDGEAGGCSVAGEMDWHTGQSAHTMCDGTTRHPLRYFEKSCTLTDEMLTIGNSITNAGWVDEISPIALYDGGTKAVAGARWNTAQLRFDLSAEPAAPTVIGSPTMATGRVDISDVIIRNNHVFSISPDLNGSGRIFASPLSNMATSYSYPSSGAVAGNRMCNALGLAMNDAGTVAFATAWHSGGATCDYSFPPGSCILNIFNTSNPASMSEITHVNLSSLASNGNTYCNEAYFRDNKLFVSFASGPGNGGLMILDVSNPASPTLLGQRWVTGIGNTQFDFFDVSADGNLAIMVSRTGRVVSMDVSNPSNPTVLSSTLNLPNTGGASDVVIVKNYAFIAMKPNHIYAVNIADPSDLRLDATITDNIFSSIGQMVLSGEYIYYTSTGSGRLGILELNCDVENSGAPSLGICSDTAQIEFEPSIPLYKYCDGSDWRPMTGDPCSDDKRPQPGTLCFDGSHYVGEHPTIAGARVFTTPNDVGAIARWSTETVVTGAISFVDGLANQRRIKTTRTMSNYPAFQACDNLNAGGHNDWYLPSLAELDMLYSYLATQPAADSDNPTAAYAGSGSGGSTPVAYSGPLASSFDTGSSGWYWASTEADSSFAYDMSFQSGYKDYYGNKTAAGNYNRVRCIRRTGGGSENVPFYAASYALPSWTYIQRSGTLQNAVDGPRFTISMWFKLDEYASNPDYIVLFESNMGRIQVVLASENPSDPTYQMYMQGGDASGNQRVWIDTTYVVEEGKWYHFLASVDTTTGVGRMFLNDVEMSYGYRNVVSGGQTMDIQSTNYFIPLYGGDNFFKGQMGELWYDSVYIDLGVAANRRKFISADGKPVNLGADGSTPTGSQPLIFFSGEPSQWGVNKGRGGTFSQTGRVRYYPLDP